MTKKFIAGGCSFTFGHELSDDQEGKVPSKKTWAYGLMPTGHEYVCTARPGSGNSGIARRVFKQDELLNTINTDCSNAIIENYDDKNAEALFYLLSCVRKLERAGDLTKNIAEELIFSIESKVIKHRKNNQ